MDFQSEKINEISAALARAQYMMEKAVKDSTNPYFKSKYADLASVMDACMAALNAEGIAVAQTVEVGEPPALVTRLLHSSGQWISSKCPLYCDRSNKNSMHALGSAITYARRYSLAAICGVSQEDDDANGAGTHKAEPITKKEADALDKLIGDDDAYRSCVMNFIRKQFAAEKLVEMPRDVYKKILPVAEKKFNERAELQKAVGE